MKRNLRVSLALGVVAVLNACGRGGLYFDCATAAADCAACYAQARSPQACARHEGCYYQLHSCQPAPRVLHIPIPADGLTADDIDAAP